MNFSYSVNPDGIPGNDDFGTLCLLSIPRSRVLSIFVGALSSWYVWAALGLYPQAGNATYMLGSPSFPNATIVLPSGVLQIIAHNASATNVYVQRAVINGRPIDTVKRAFLDHTELVRPGGALLECWMSPVAPSV